MEDKDLEKVLEYIKLLGIEYIPKLALAIVTLIVGLWLVARITKFTRRMMETREVDVSLIPFVSGIVNIGLKILLIISVASMVGIATTSFVAVLGAAGLAIGLALQGSLGNFAGGVLILLFKPFKVGDLIESDGAIGTVQSITILNTILITPADNTAILPNGNVANNKILNYTKENNRRVDLEVGIAYHENVDKAKEVIEKALQGVPGVLENPKPFVSILNFGDSSVNLAVRPFCNSTDYWDVYFLANEAVKKALDNAKIEIPFPQRDITIKSGGLS
ncbi:MAG: mechanosensitive ion channel [Bacteroidia bacterium]|nr:mechanosensitive ion channel [Bacteroidia bacterium]NNJ56126.1 mechanosensitive ion channel [Bacteroidia bacterium]